MRNFREAYGVFRSKLLSTQLDALEEIVDLAIIDPTIREILSSCVTNEMLEPRYSEPVLSIASFKALSSIHDSEVNALWSRFYESCIRRDVPADIAFIETFPKRMASYL